MTSPRGPIETNPYADWLTTAGVRPDRVEPVLRDLDRHANRIVDELVSTSSASRHFTPGNGWTYHVVFTLLGIPEEGDAPLRGRLLVSLPELHACTLLDAVGLHVPHYLHEKLKVADVHCAFVAVLTTMVSARLEGLI